jgi:hypothetical protein
MRSQQAAVGIAAMILFCGLFWQMLQCSPSLPSAAQQARVEAYAADLQGCIVFAKGADAGLAGYKLCAYGVDEQFGLVDGGTDGSH